MSKRIGPYVNLDGLVAHFDAGNSRSYDPSNLAYLSDLTKYDNNFYISFPPFSYQSGQGGSIYMDGTLYGSLGPDVFNSNFNFTGNITLDFWFKISATSNPVQPSCIMCFGANDPSTQGESISISMANQAVGGIIDQNELYCYVGGSGTNGIRRTNCIISYDTIYNVVISASNGTTTISMYVNGVNYPITNASTLALGNVHLVGQYFSLVNYQILKGNLYSGKVYNRILSSDEILQNYTNLKYRF